MQFRKVCNHPYVFEQVEEAINPMKVTDMNLVRVCGKFELLDRILPKMKVTGHRILMFFQMTQIMDIMEDYLRYKSFSYLRLDGNTKADDRTMMLNTFNSKADPPFIFLLSTRAGGLGLNLQTADTVIIYDSDWNPHQDLQAQDRAHRIGQKKEVRILRLITSKSVEEAILARAQYKLDLDGKVIQAGKFDQKTTDREREDLLRTLLGGESDSEEEKEREGEMEDGELNEIIARDEEELVLFNKMDAERRMQEEQDHVARGGTLPYHRLIQESELPPIFIQSEVAPVAPVEYTGRGARQRKEIVYEDPAAEDMFAETTENDVKDFMVREKRKQEQLKEAISDDEEGIDLVDPTFDPVEGIGADIMRIYKAVVDVVDHSDGYPRQRCELYMDLPDRQLYEDYYSLIANPISLHVIKKKIQHNGYANLEEAKTDFMTLCQNAKEYNTPESQVYQDAIVLQQVFEEVYRKRKQVDQETVDNDNAARKRMKIEDDDLESFEAVSEAVDSEIVDGSSLY